jgi:hypothetical protein
MHFLFLNLSAIVWGVWLLIGLLSTGYFYQEHIREDGQEVDRESLLITFCICLTFVAGGPIFPILGLGRVIYNRTHKIKENK